MKNFWSTVFLMSISTGLTAQSPSEGFYYTLPFSILLKDINLEIRADSLGNYVVSNQKNNYLDMAQLHLIQPESSREYFVVVDRGVSYPHINLGNRITNMMDNEQEHALAFYSLDREYIRHELKAVWAADVQFVPKEPSGLVGYARSFFKEEEGIQVTLILLASELPLLTTPRELYAFRFKED